MKKLPYVYLKDALQSINIIQKRVKNISEKQFTKNIELQDGIIRRLEIIGEVISKLPQDFKKKHSELNGKFLLI